MAKNFVLLDGAAYEREFRELTLEYVASLGRDLAFQHLDEELESPSRKYIGSGGGMIVALCGAEVVGCVAYWGHTAERCEMKRLYVKPEYRKSGIGLALGREVIRRARESGFTEMVLDTAKPLVAAISLYKKLGFKETEPYYYNPMEDVLYFRRSL